MRRLLVSLGLLACLVLAPTVTDAAAPQFRLTSPDLKSGAMIANTFVFNAGGCTGGNVSPALSWSGAPEGTKSFVLTVYDPDAPTGSGFWHWVMFNIPPSVTSLPQGAGAPGKEPAGATQIENDYGTVGYGGPCPPKGAPHRYIFTIYALSADKLDLPASVHAAVVGFNVHFKTLGKAQIMARYGQ
jgi:Raf kinase inhibitor-like YbhB/YbcL family protein